MPNFREYNQSQMSFLFLTPDKLLEETHPARIIDKIAETLDLQKIIDSYKNEGNIPYNPKMQLKVLFYAYYIQVLVRRDLSLFSLVLSFWLFEKEESRSQERVKKEVSRRVAFSPKSEERKEKS